MISQKKGVETHLIAIFIVSIIMGFFLLFVLSNFYAEDPEKCHFLDYDITRTCKTNLEVEYTIKNTGASLVKMQINDESSDAYNVEPFSTEELRYTFGKNEEVSIVPVVNQGVETSQCRSKLKKAKVRDIRRC